MLTAARQLSRSSTIASFQASLVLLLLLFFCFVFGLCSVEAKELPASLYCTDEQKQGRLGVTTVYTHCDCFLPFCNGEVLDILSSDQHSVD